MRRGVRNFVCPLGLVVIGLFNCALSRAQAINAQPSNAQLRLQKRSFMLPENVPAPANNRTTPARAELGKMLFFDPRLSGSDWISCATCHNPALGWSDGLPIAIGNGMGSLKRSTPPIVNSGFNKLQMWDGRYSSLEEQALDPMQGAKEMNGNMPEILAKLKSNPGYSRAFEKAYPGEPVTKATVAKAIASFERTIVSRDSPFDAWIRGNEAAISPAAKRGFELFVGKADCAACHNGPNFSDDGFHNIGLKDDGDEGRYARVPIKISMGAFKTPTLRDVALTTPYMHNGSYQTLEEVVNHYDRGGDNKVNLDPSMKPLNLTEREKEDLVQFLKTLSGKRVPVTLPRLPE